MKMPLLYHSAATYSEGQAVLGSIEGPGTNKRKDKSL